MDIAIERTSAVTIFSLKGKMDAVSAPHFEASLKGDEQNLIIDMKDLDYISSAGLRCLLMVGRQVRDNAGSLILCGLGGIVLEVFELSGFTKLFPIAETLAGARELLP